MFGIQIDREVASSRKYVDIQAHRSVLQENRYAFELKSRREGDVVDVEALNKGAGGLLCHQTGKPCPNAMMRPTRERDVPRTPPVESEIIGVIEERFVAIR